MTDDIDPPPQLGTVLPRWYPDAPTDPKRPSARPSSVWSVRLPDGSETTAEFDGPPLAHPDLRTVLQSLFAEPTEPDDPTAVPAAADDQPLLRVAWCADGEQIATAALFDDGRLLVDDGSGLHLDRRLDGDQLRRLREALAAAF